MKKFKDIREDKFDKSKEKHVDLIQAQLTKVSKFIVSLDKLDKQGEGKGEMANDLKVLHKANFEFQKALTKVKNRLV
tara:strand:+ start:277 stop:507 length:231 start_codon:yes stop_codon:yes gene_type:complete